MTPWALGHGLESSGTTSQIREPSCMGLSRWEGWSTLRALQPGPESPGRAGRPRRHWDLGPSSAAHLVDTVGPHTWARDAHDIWSTLQGLRSGPKSPGTTGQSHGPSDLISSRPRQLFNTRALGHRPKSPGSAGVPHRPSGTGLSHPGRQVDTAGTPTRSRISWDIWSTPWALGPGPESPGTAGRPHRPKGSGPNTQNRRSTSWALGHETE